MSYRDFPPGQGVRLGVRITEDGEPVDPATVVCKVLPPGAGSPTVYSGGQITKDAAGRYHVDVTPATVGTWTYRFETTSPDTATDDATFTVPASALT